MQINQTGRFFLFCFVCFFLLFSLNALGYNEGKEPRLILPCWFLLNNSETVKL